MKINYLPWKPLLLTIAVLSACGKKSADPDPAPPSTPPTVSIEDVALFEGNTASQQFSVSVSLSRNAEKEVSVKWSTAEGTAKAGGDFTAVDNATLVFAPGEKTKSVTVVVSGDDIREPDETFSIQLSSPSNATLSRSTATVSIKNDDSKIVINNAGYDAATTYVGKTLVWSDECDGPAVDIQSWTFQNGDGCPNICGWGNNELEYYRPENLTFQEGKMLIEAKKESLGGRAYTSSKIIGAGKNAFKYGRIDIRAILPKGKGFWPAFWLLPEGNKFGNWPTSGEIDIMELVGNEPGKVLGTVHYGPGPGSIHTSGTYTLPGSKTFNDEFHVFSLEWEEDTIRWYVDDQLFYTVTKTMVAPQTYPFNEDFFFIVNFAVGGNWPGSPDATSVFPQWLIVDYIRLYQ
ncbi:family 16 glycosylhydrolase [Flavihumibacter petaseus]|nr:family 16 glycosylhydrolase [Flavihumibacter petaseus]